MPADPTIAIRLKAVTGGFRRAIGKVSTSLKTLGIAGKRSGKELDEGFSRARRGVESISRQLDNTRRMVRNLAVGYGSLRALSSVFRDAADMEGIQASLKAVAGSSGAAAREFAFVRAEAERLGLPLKETARQYLGMMAAARGTRLEGEGVRQIFSAISEAAVVLNMSTGDLSGSLLAIQQIISKGTVSAEELRQQLGERLHGAFQIAARSIGIQTEDLNTALQRGLLQSEDFLLAFARQVRTEMGGSVDAASKTTRRELARLGNAFLELKLELARSGFLDAATEAFRDLAEALKDPAIVEGARTLGRGLAAAIPGIMKFAGAMGYLVDEAKQAFGVIADNDIVRLREEAELVRDMLDGGPSVRLTFPLAASSVELVRFMLDGGPLSRVRFSGKSDDELKAELKAIESKIRAWKDRQYKEFFKPKSEPAGSGANPADADEAARRIRERLSGVLGKDKADSARRRKSALDAELLVLRDGLARQVEALDASLDQRLISLREYYRRKAEAERQSIDAEAGLAGKRLAAARDAGDQESIVRLEAELVRLSRERAAIAARAVREQATAERELAGALAQAREELAQITGAGTDARRREAIATAYRDLRARLLAEGDAGGVSLIDRLVDVKAAQANLDALESQWRLTAERMRNAQEAIRIQQQAGLLTETQAREQIVRLQHQSATEMEKLLPLMEQAARAIGPEAVTRVQAWKNELARTKLVVDEVAVRVKGRVQDAFATMFERIGSGAQSAREAFRGFARSVISMIQRIAAQKLAASLFGGMSGGFGALVSAAAGGYADGGYVTGPGTSTSDSIPARLSAGEYVINAASVRKVGVAFLDAINGGAFAPRWRGPSLAFAAGGLVPNAGRREKPQVNVRVVNAVDESLVGDFLATPAGEQVITNVIRRNAATVRQYLGG